MESVIASARQISQGDDARAEAEVVATFEALYSELAQITPHQRWYISRACERVIGMYEAMERSQEVETWQAKRRTVQAEIDRLRESGQPH